MIFTVPLQKRLNEVSVKRLWRAFKKFQKSGPWKIEGDNISEVAILDEQFRPALCLENYLKTKREYHLQPQTVAYFLDSIDAMYRVVDRNPVKIVSSNKKLPRSKQRRILASLRKVARVDTNRLPLRQERYPLVVIGPDMPRLD